MNKRRKPKLSYFYSNLQRHLYEHFPELIDDEEFIRANVDIAENTYIALIDKGHSVFYALSKANKELLNGLEFSKFDMLYDIVTEEFTMEIPEENYREFSENMLGVCNGVFARYPPQESEELRTELAGTIAAYIDGLKQI